MLNDLDSIKHHFENDRFAASTISEGFWLGTKRKSCGRVPTEKNPRWVACARPLPSVAMKKLSRSGRGTGAGAAGSETDP